MGGLFGMQGPPAVLYFLSVSKTKEQYTGIAQAYFLFGNAMMTISHAYNGFFTQKVLLTWALGIPSILFGTWLGTLAYSYISLTLLKKIVYIYIAISGVLALVA